MPLDLRALKPAEVVRLLNGAKFGAVLTRPKLTKILDLAGSRVFAGDGKSIDLVALVRWLAGRPRIQEAGGSGQEAAEPASDYGAYKGRQAKMARARSESGREIGPLPPVADPARRAACMASGRLFLETYFPALFYWPWSKDQEVVISREEECLIRGGLAAVGMTRGGGKTRITLGLTLWAVLKGLRKFPVVIGATGTHAQKMMLWFKSTLETNDLLLADFPEVCYPIRCLEGIVNRSAGQLLNGKNTAMVWRQGEIRLPVVDSSICTGAYLCTRGITGSIRGLNLPAAGGGDMRPDCVLLDDVQTRESARSAQQTNYRLEKIQSDILELAGPNTKIAAFAMLTVIYPNDLAFQLLDREKQPAWRGEKFQAVYSFPSNKELWEQYAQIRTDSQRAGGDGAEATEFYAANRTEMDAGAVVAWPDRVKPGDLSALQTAMNAKIDDPKSFAAEWQNKPEIAADLGDLRQLEGDDLALKLNRQPRGTAPRDCNRVTCFIDVQQEILFWLAAAWNDRFGGSIVSYGSWPNQPVPMFTKDNPPRSLSMEYPGRELRARLYAGLEATVQALLTKQFPLADSSDHNLSPSLCLIDARFETDTIHEVISRSPYKALLKASMGRGLKADDKPMNEYSKQPGDVMGHNWRIDARTTGKGRYVSFDANSWKSFIAEGLFAPAGSAAAIYLPGAAMTEHPLLQVHLLSEYRIRTWGRGRAQDVWKLRPGSRDNQENHWWDGLVGCGVAASVCGLQVSATGAPAPAPERKAATREEYEQQRAEFERRRGR